MPKTKKDLSGKIFGRLKVVGFAFRNTSKHAYWICECECGVVKNIEVYNLTSGHTKSCGCLNKELARTRTLTHGASKSRLYNTWCGMKGRCYRPSTSSYKLYGGRGIKVCDEWLDFGPFLIWALNNGYTDDLSIERIDNDKDYSPSNCRWIPINEQSKNRRNNLKFNGINAIDFSKELGGGPGMIQQRLKLGWSINDALSLPKYSKWGNYK